MEVWLWVEMGADCLVEGLEWPEGQELRKDLEFWLEGEVASLKRTSWGC